MKVESTLRLSRTCCGNLNPIERLWPEDWLAESADGTSFGAVLILKRLSK